MMTRFRLVLRLVLRTVPKPSVVVVIVLILLLSPVRLRLKVGATEPPESTESTESTALLPIDQPADDAANDDARWLLQCERGVLEDGKEPDPSGASCRLPLTVNYRSLETEFSLELNCTVPPSSTEYSRKMFRKVQEYRLSGREAHGRVGLGLAYLHYPENVRRLVLGEYCLATIQPGTFDAFHRLDRLELTDSTIRLLASGSFRGLGTLKELRLMRDRFERMGPCALRHLEQLEQLVVHGSGTLNFTVNRLEALESFKVLDSRVTNLTALVATLPPALKQLQFVYVHSATPTVAVVIESGTGPGPYPGPGALVKLTLVNCTVRSATIRNLPALLTLNLSQNALNERNLLLAGLPSLKLLVLSYNVLRELPAGLLEATAGRTPSLATVDLAHNEITYIHPQAFGADPVIARLDLTDNRLLSLDYDIGDWPRLAVIRADQNPWDCMWLRDSALFERFEYTNRDRFLSVSGLPCNLPALLGAADQAPSPASNATDQPDNVTVNRVPFDDADDDAGDDDDQSTTNPIMHPRPKVQVTVTMAPQLRLLTIVIVVIVGIVIANVCVLLYNRYRNLQQVPFYRATRSVGGLSGKMYRRSRYRTTGFDRYCCGGTGLGCRKSGGRGSGGGGMTPGFASSSDASEADPGLDIAMTEKSSSFMYETPIEGQPGCSYTATAIGNIYEEIVEVEEPTPAAGARPAGYDVLQFDLHQQVRYAPDNETNSVYV